jgi:hypothetical protein
MIDGLLLEGSFEYQEIVDTGGQALVYQGTLTTGAGTCYLNLTFRTGFSGIEAPSGSYCGFAARPSMTP